MSEPAGQKYQTQSLMGEERLPFEPHTFLLGLWRRRWALLMVAVVSGAAGVMAGLTLGWRTYEAETVLLYKPSTEAKNLYAVPSVTTYMSMVKIRSNLEEVNRRLNLGATLSALESAFSVVAEKNSDLMIICARAKTPALAADMANMLRDVFLEAQTSVRRSEAAKMVRDLEARLATVTEQLRLADRALNEFNATHKVVNLDKEAQKYLDQLTTIDVLCDNARLEKAAIDMKAANIGRIEADLRRRLMAEKVDLADDPQKLYELNIRLERLRDAIREDQSIRAALAELAQREVDLQQAKKLFEKGVISELEYEKAKNAYEKQKALAIDTEKIREWRNEIDKLHEAVLPVKPEAIGSAPVLREILVKSFDLQLEQAAASEKVKRLEEARRRVSEKLEILPKLQRQFVELSREVSAREAEKQAIENLLAQARRIHESQAGDFGIVSKATPPEKPIRSTRTLICIIVAFLGCFFGGAIVVVLELMDTTIKSSAEFALRLPIPLLGVIPCGVPQGIPIFPDKSDFAPMEAFRVVARKIRATVPKKGAIILVVSADYGEGKTLVAANLATCYGRQDERVLLLDAQVRTRESTHEIRHLIPELTPTFKGLGDYLNFQAEGLKEVVSHTFLPGVDCIPRGTTPAIPDYLGSHRMRCLLEEASRCYSLVLVDVPPIIHYADAEFLGQWADAIVLVIRSQQVRASQVKKVMERLAACKTPVIGGILNAVAPLYMTRSL